MTEGGQTIMRALDVLRAVAAAGDGGCRLSDAARSLGLHKATAARVLATLEAAGALERRRDKAYRVAATFRVALGLPPSEARVRAIGRALLARLADGLADAAFLSVRSGYEAVCVDRQVGPFPIQALSLDVGSRRPLGVGAGSLALCAFLPEDEREEILSVVAGRLGDYPRFDRAVLEDLAAEARSRGLAEVRDLIVPGMTGLGLPLRATDGSVVAALSVSAINERLTGARRERAVALLEECRASFSRTLATGDTAGVGNGRTARPDDNARGGNDHEVHQAP